MVLNALVNESNNNSTNEVFAGNSIRLPGKNTPFFSRFSYLFLLSSFAASRHAGRSLIMH